MTAIGGENVSTTIEGRERYPINIRYPREMRDDVDKLARTLVAVPNAAGAMGGGAQIPLGQLATIKLVEGPSMIRDGMSNLLSSSPCHCARSVAGLVGPSTPLADWPVFTPKLSAVS